jgi:hypothetical protein
MRPKDIKNLDDLKSYYRTDFQFGSVIDIELTATLDYVDMMLFGNSKNLTDLKKFWIRLHISARAILIHQRSIGRYEIARFYFRVLQILSRLNPFVSSLLQREINQRKVNETQR